MQTRRIAIIDSGVDPQHPLLRDRIRVIAVPSPVEPADRDELGHGTAVAAVIAQFLEPDDELEIVSLRVFESEPVCEFGAVAGAMQSVLEFEPGLINLSIGTTSLRHRSVLEHGIAAAKAANVDIVTPASYLGLPCDPGNLDGVEAVVGDPNVLPLMPELRPHAGRMLWFASPLPPRGKDGTRTLVARGESLAVAAVSGFLMRRMSR